jgi:hypothetical protein
MSKAIEKGEHVRHEARPEYGVGRVIAVGVFATRVIFPTGGLRVFRAHDTVRLKVVATPSAEDLAILDGKVAALAAGTPDMPKAKSKPAADKPAKKRAPKKAAP